MHLRVVDGLVPGDRHDVGEPVSNASNCSGPLPGGLGYGDGFMTSTASLSFSVPRITCNKFPGGIVLIYFSQFSALI